MDAEIHQIVHDASVMVYGQFDNLARDEQFRQAVEKVLRKVEKFLSHSAGTYTSAKSLRQKTGRLYAITDSELNEVTQARVRLASSFWTRVGGNRWEVLDVEDWIRHASRLNFLAGKSVRLAIELRNTMMDWRAQLNDMETRLRSVQNADPGASRKSAWSTVGASLQRWVMEGRVIVGSSADMESLLDESGISLANISE